MIFEQRRKKRSIPNRAVLSVTSAYSLQLLGQIPQTLTDGGWDVHVVSSGGTEVAQFQEGNPEVTMHQISMDREPEFFQDMAALWGWIQLIRLLRPSVVSNGTPKAGLLGTAAAFLLGVPHRVYIVRGLRYETARPPARWALILAELVTMVSATDVLAVSPSVAQAVRNLPLPSLRPSPVVLGFGASKGVDGNRFRPRERSQKSSDLAQIGKKDFVVGFLGRLAVDKGIFVLRQASNMLSLEGFSHQLIFAGPSELSEPVDTFLEGFVAPTVYRGALSDPVDFYHQIDILCLPTLREGLPNVVLEAGACGVPVITTNATGAVDSVVEGSTGLIVSVNSAEELAVAIRRLSEDHQLFSVIRKKARSITLERFSERVVTSNTRDYFGRFFQG